MHTFYMPKRIRPDIFFIVKKKHKLGVDHSPRKLHYEALSNQLIREKILCELLPNFTDFYIEYLKLLPKGSL